MRSKLSAITPHGPAAPVPLGRPSRGLTCAVLLRPRNHHQRRACLLVRHGAYKDGGLSPFGALGVDAFQPHRAIFVLDANLAKVQRIMKSRGCRDVKAVLLNSRTGRCRSIRYWPAGVVSLNEPAGEMCRP